MLVAALVKVALEKLQHGTAASVHVRPEEVADWNRYFEGDTSGEIQVEVKPDSSVAAHNCVLETELGTTELGIDVAVERNRAGIFRPAGAEAGQQMSEAVLGAYSQWLRIILRPCDGKGT